MSLILDKIVPLFIYPVGFAVLAGLLSLLALALDWRRGAIGCVTIATLYLWLAATPIVALGLINSLERQYPIVSIDKLPKAQIAIVLGGVSVPSQTFNPYPDMKSGADRILHAARLLKAGKVDAILVSGGRAVSRLDARPEANVIAGFLKEFGVDEAVIVLETGSRNTHENAVNSLARMRAGGFHLCLAGHLCPAHATRRGGVS